MKKLRNIYYVSIMSLMLTMIMGASMFAAVTIDRATPIGENTSRNNYEAITVTFNQQMVALQAITDITNEYFTFNVDVEGKYRWLSINTLAFYPSKPLPDNTAIEVTLKKGIKSELTGEVLENDYTWSFNTLRPIMQKSSPYDRQSELPTDVNIVVYYNMPIYLQSAKEKIHLISSNNNTAIDFDVRYARIEDLREWETNEYQLEQVLVIKPKTALTKNDGITVNIDQGLAAVNGDLGTADAKSFSFSIHDDFYFSGNKEQTVTASYSPEAPKLEFSTRVEWADLIRNIEITPEVQLPTEEEIQQSSWSSKSFSLYSLRFNPNVTYNIKINGNLKDSYGQTLGEEQNITLNVTDYNPSVSIPSGMGVVEAYEGMKLPVQLMNPNTINIRSRYVDKENIIPFLFVNKQVYRYDEGAEFRSYTNQYGNLFGYDNTTEYTPNIERNRYITTALYLTNYMNNNNYGFLSIEFKSKTGYQNQYDYSSSSQIQITSMGVTGKFSGDSNTIFVTDLKTGMPVEGAEVEIRDDFNRVLDRATTDENGIATTKGFRELGIKRASRWEDVEKSYQEGKDAGYFENFVKGQDLSTARAKYYSALGDEQFEKGDYLGGAWSKFGAFSDWPFIIDYTFKSPAQLDYIVYTPRTDNGTRYGAFNEFNVYVMTNGSSEWTKVAECARGDKNYTPTTIQLEQSYTDVKQVRFEIQSAHNNRGA